MTNDDDSSSLFHRPRPRRLCTLHDSGYGNDNEIENDDDDSNAYWNKEKVVWGGLFASLVWLIGFQIWNFYTMSETLNRTVSKYNNGKIVLANRFSVLDFTSTFGFVHISKCAGASYIQELAKIWNPQDFETQVYPNLPTGPEHSVSWQQWKYPRRYTLTSLKSPRHHVWSMFTECRYDPVFEKQTKQAKFPRDHLDGTQQGDLLDFEEWLNSFVVQQEQEPTKISNRIRHKKNNDNPYRLLKTKKDFKCYHPSNYQSRAFSVYHREPHGITSFSQLEPDFDIVNETYWTLDWVAIADLFHESKCLLYYRMNMTATTTTTTLGKNTSSINETSGLLQDFLETYCQCPIPHVVSSVNTHAVHHDGGSRSSMRDGISNETLSKIDALTRVDVQLYKTGLVQLLKEIVWLEQKSNLGRRVLCDNRLKVLDYELDYLWPNTNKVGSSNNNVGSISRLYQSIQQQAAAAKGNFPRT